MKKSTHCIAAATALLLPTFAFCETDTPKPAADAPRDGAPRDPAALFRSLDTDGDGAITKEEAGERWERLSALDKDGDGRVTLEEFRAAREGMRRPDGADRPDGARRPEGAGAPRGGGEELFNRLDRDGDGKLSESEVPAEMWARLSRLDTDEDGYVSREEFLAGAAAMRGAKGEGRRPGSRGAPDSSGTPGEGQARAEEYFNRLDRDGDGKLSESEVPAEAWARLSRHDTNEDGYVSREEFLAGAAALRGAMEGGRRPGASRPDGKGRPAAGGRPGAGGAGGAGGGADALMSRYDKNEDGKLSEDEVPAELWARIRRADEDGDGHVSAEELRKSYQARPQTARPAPESKESKEAEDDSADSAPESISASGDVPAPR